MKTRTGRLWAIALALTLLLGTLSGGALAAGGPIVTYSPVTADSAAIYVENLDGTDIYAVQLELTFDGEYPDAALTAADDTAYQPGKPAVVRDGKTTLTVYIVNGDKPLNRGRVLSVGTLRMGEKFTMPDSAKLSALDESSRPLKGADNTAVTVSRHVESGGSVVVKPTPTPTPTPAGALPFTDVRPEHWFYPAVRFVHENKLMSGMTATAFSPDTPTNRGMIVTILYRMEGSPAAGTPAFSDVPADKYYTKAIAWAVKNNIVSGYPGGTFAPESNITREQLAAILYRYAVYKGYGVTGRASLAGFADTGDVSAYASDALRWAVDAGLMSGVTGTTLVPKGSATRAQAASILMRFCETVAK